MSFFPYSIITVIPFVEIESPKAVTSLVLLHYIESNNTVVFTRCIYELLPTSHIFSVLK